MAEISNPKSKKQIALEKAEKALIEAQEVLAEAQKDFAANPSDKKIKAAYQDALKARAAALVKQTKAKRALETEESTKVKVENNELETDSATRWQKVSAHVKQYKNAYIAAGVALLLVIGAGASYGYVKSGQTADELQDVQGSVAKTAEEVLGNYNTAKISAEEAIANAVIANNAANEVYQEAVAAETAQEAMEAWLKAKGNVEVVAYDNSNMTVYSQAMEAKSDTAESKGSLTAIRADLDHVEQTEAVSNAKSHLDNVLLVDGTAPATVTFDATSYTVAPANAMNVKYTVAENAKAREGESVEVSSIVYADTIAQNAITIADAAAQIAQSKLNEMEVNGVELNATQVAQVAPSVLGSKAGEVTAFQAYSYVGDDLVLYFNGDDGFNHNALYQVTINTNDAQFTHIKDDSEEGKAAFNQEVVDYIVKNKIKSVCFISSQGIVGKGNEDLLDSTLNFSAPGSESAATLNDVMFNVTVEYSEKTNSSVVSYQVLVVNEEDGSVTVYETDALTFVGERLDVSAARAEVVANYLATHEVRAVQNVEEAE